MKVTKSDFSWAATQGLITDEQANKVWEALQQRIKDNPTFDLVHVSYYFGAFIIMAAMGWLITEAWDQFGGSGLTCIALFYALGFAFIGNRLWHTENLKIPGGLLFTLAVWMTPLAVFGIQKMTGLWPDTPPGRYPDYFHWIKGGWFYMEVATIAAGMLALKYIRFPFLTFPVAFALWYMSMDITPLLFGQTHPTGDARSYVSLMFGLVMLLVAYFIDRKTREDYAFWGYLFGMMAFWGGLTTLDITGELWRFMVCLINLFFVVLSALFQRKVFIVFGSIGVFTYLGYLSQKVFADSLMFPFALCLLGGAIMFLGVQYQKHYTQITTKLAERIPPDIRRLLPPERT